MDFTQLRVKKLGDNSFAEIHEGLAHNFYELKEISLPEKEAKLATILQKIIQGSNTLSELGSFEELPDNFGNKFREEIVSVVEINGLNEKIPSKSVLTSLLIDLLVIIDSIKFISNKELFAKTVLQNSVGLKQLSFFSLDESLEELMINGLGNIFVFHREFGMCKTNLSIEERAFENLLQRIANTIGKEFNLDSPLLDARLPDGSRVNATFSIVSPKGISLTIRKFLQTPLTILDLIEKGAVTSEAAAFLWLMNEGFGIAPKNILVTGGTASGKTTFLNTLSNFIRLSDRIISIEDTLEISLLNRENWVALEAKHSGNEITMDSLLKNSLRMRPDRLIVGEVRGKEALTLFTAMDNGHAGCLGTVHSNNAKELIIKLQERPFEVPKTMLPLVDLIVVMQRTYSKEKGMRRSVNQIAEVTRMEDKVLLANVYETNSNGELVRSDVPSHIMEQIANDVSVTKNEIKKEIETRRLILEWLIEKDVRQPLEILEFIQSYYFNPEKVLSMIYK
ncbi:MAG: CpaF family protein [Candidatus Diapherotrites archaeon]|jgi:archaeal flagellar protein FlaI|uniref:CpaF family protein n=1 Tax=Candidatus Iainarchaeum sp. TaxID=3101447 RepID=A0A8T5GFQ4_9ARCH|nr:CpaF family protein [Candidatus Diapherotrites archaeon]MBT7241382.1 CpaF family protein [Candidatus Diapherotrites archaeon]